MRFINLIKAPFLFVFILKNYWETVHVFSIPEDPV